MPGCSGPAVVSQSAKRELRPSSAAANWPASHHSQHMLRMISREVVDGLRRVYYSHLDTRDAGFIETDHFGRRFIDAVSHFDITGISQRWLRDMLWDHLAEILRSPRCPR